MRTYRARYRDGIGRWSVAYVQALSTEAAVIALCRRGINPIGALS